MRLLLAILLTLTVGQGCVGHRKNAAHQNAITLENEHRGTADWRITERQSDGLSRQIEGYASATSVTLGGEITLFVSVNTAQPYSIEIYRIGYYQGLGGRLIQRSGPIKGTPQPKCPMDKSAGMIACRWSPGYLLSIPSTWTTGIYLAKLINSQRYQSYAMFVVRDDTRHADLLYQQSVNTYQAYNNYPNDLAAGTSRPKTGKSLYEGGSSSAQTGLGTTRAVKVSFDRPYASGDGAGDFLDTEIHFVRWLEQFGYDVSYSTDVDTHTNGDRLLQYKGFLSVGHDEYWSEAMYDAAIGARDHGVGLGFFGANAVYWQIRFEPSATGVPNRIIVCYKSSSLDPVRGSNSTVRWRDLPVNRPEQQLIGVQFSSEQPDHQRLAPYVGRNIRNWVYAGTGMAEGDEVPGIVGYEADRQFLTVPLPAYVPGTYVLLSRSPYVDASGDNDTQTSVVYQAGSGSWVFGAGSIAWSLGLRQADSGGRADPRIARMTANVLDRFLRGAVARPAAPSQLRDVGNNGDTVDLAWANRAKDARELILERSDSATFQTFTSIALSPDSTSYRDAGASAGVNYYRVRAVARSGSSPCSNVVGVSTIAFDQLLTEHAGLLSRWRLGEHAGRVAADEAGHLNGTYQGGVRFDQPGAVTGDPDTAVALNGLDGDIDLPSLPAVTDFSIEGWTMLAPDSVRNDNGNNALFGALRSVRVLVRPGATTAALVGVWLSSKEYTLQPASNLSNVGRWVQWVLTRSKGTLTLYRNGTQIAQRTDLPPADPVTLSGSIGAQGSSRYFLAGRVDELAVYSSALSASDVADHYTAALAGPAS